MVLPFESLPLCAMSAPLLIRTGSWKRLSGVRFSWKITTTCLIFPGGGGGGGGELPPVPPQPLRLRRVLPMAKTRLARIKMRSLVILAVTSREVLVVPDD